MEKKIINFNKSKSSTSFQPDLTKRFTKFDQAPPFCLRVILSPKLRAIPCVLLLIRIYPLSFPSPCFSMLKFTNASSPNTLFAYKLAARNPQSPSSADLPIPNIFNLLLLFLHTRDHKKR
ncbi:hypothetical protein Hanom_Chr07g00579811 [Helianthus anomalus]